MSMASCDVIPAVAFQIKVTKYLSSCFGANCGALDITQVCHAVDLLMNLPLWVHDASSSNSSTFTSLNLVPLGMPRNMKHNFFASAFFTQSLADPTRSSNI